MTGDSEPPATRIGHQEREDAVEALGQHFSVGRLSADEYSERVGRAWDSRTGPDLRALFGDLPAPHPASLAPTQRPGPPDPRRGAPYPTPAWPAAGVDPWAPYGRHPRTGVPYSDKSKIVAGILQLFLPFGIGRFYSGHVGLAIAQLILFFVGGIGLIWSWIDGIVLLVSEPHDPDGRPMRS